MSTSLLMSSMPRRLDYCGPRCFCRLCCPWHQHPKHDGACAESAAPGGGPAPVRPNHHHHHHRHPPRCLPRRSRLGERILVMVVLACAGCFCAVHVFDDVRLFRNLVVGRDPLARACPMSDEDEDGGGGGVQFSGSNCGAVNRLFSAYRDRFVKKIVHQLLKPGPRGKRGQQGARKNATFVSASAAYRRNETVAALLEQLRRYPPKIFTDETPPWDRNPLGKYLKQRGPIMGGRTYKTCACVSSSGLMIGRKLGKFIDSHDVVLRMNIAPVKGFEEDVGSKTTIRMINNEMLRWMGGAGIPDKYKAWLFPDSRNATLLAWESCLVRGPITKCLKDPLLENVTKPGGESIQSFFKWRRQNMDKEFYFLDTEWLWNVLDVLQWYSPGIIANGVPSTGFLGFAFLMHFCETVRVFELIPSIDFSTRDKEPRYYFDDDRYEAYGDYIDGYHPKVAEILFLLAANVGEPSQVFGDGYATIPGLALAGNLGNRSRLYEGGR